MEAQQCKAWFDEWIPASAGRTWNWQLGLKPVQDRSTIEYHHDGVHIWWETNEEGGHWWIRLDGVRLYEAHQSKGLSYTKRGP